jgi:Protein of unknown function (DUF3570)
MRVQVMVRFAAAVGVLVGALALVTYSGWADNVVNFSFHAFQDSRAVTVLAPLGSLDKDFTDRTGLRVKFGVDAISAASDSCARCHPNGRQMQHNYFGASVLHKFGDLKVDVGGEISRETFYASDTGTISLSRDFNKANTTVAGGYSFQYNQPTLHPSSNVETQLSHDLYASVTQTLSKTTVLQVTYDYNRISGYQNSPFLRTPVNGVMVLGNVPDARTRQALAVRIRQALPADTYLEADYRRYADTWSIGSNAFSLGLSHYFSPALLLGFNYRWYGQTGAFFYQPFYTGNPEFYTGDFRLAPFDSGLYSGKMVITPGEGLWGMPKGTSLALEYERYLATTNFQAATFSFGLKVPF